MPTFVALIVVDNAVGAQAALDLCLSDYPYLPARHIPGDPMSSVLLDGMEIEAMLKVHIDRNNSVIVLITDELDIVSPFVDVVVGVNSDFLPNFKTIPAAIKHLSELEPEFRSRESAEDSAALGKYIKQTIAIAQLLRGTRTDVAAGLSNQATLKAVMKKAQLSADSMLVSAEIVFLRHGGSRTEEVLFQVDDAFDIFELS